MATPIFLSARIRGIGLGLIALLLSAPSPVWSQPEPLSSATYRAVFEGTWTAENHPTGFPSNPHFSPIVGAVHNADASLWMAGEMATPGLEHVAEMGMSDMLQAEATDQIGMGDALAVVTQAPPADNSGTVSMTFYFSVTDAFPLVTLASKIAPSPDWFVGVSGLSLQDDHDDHGHWMASHTVELFPYDAGTEEGTTFSTDNADTMPAGSIMSAQGVAPFSDQPIATLTFELVEERAFHAALEQPTAGPVAGIGLVRGWAFESSDMDMTDDPLNIEILIDGKEVGSPAVGSPRGDVAANFPDEMDAEDSGFGLVMNYGVLDPGAHRLTLRGTSAMGGAHFALSREITVLKFGGFEFAEAMLSGASADMHGDAVALHGVQFSDPNDPDAMGRTQTLELEWSNAAQGFIVTEITDEDDDHGHDDDDDHDHDHDHD